LKQEEALPLEVLKNNEDVQMEDLTMKVEKMKMSIIKEEELEA
jgi:hypothetical protein